MKKYKFKENKYKIRPTLPGGNVAVTSKKNKLMYIKSMCDR